MAHGVGTAALAALVWYWQKTYGSVRPGRWLLVGVLVGVTALMRWQLATFALLPCGEVLINRRSGAASISRLVVCLALASLGALIAFAPQMIAWRCVYGHWLVAPVQRLGQHWLHPSLWALLLSQDRSLFYWTPLCLVACACAVALAFRREQAPPRLLLAAFAVQVYVLASLWGKGEILPHANLHAGVFLSRAYGMRHLTESLVALGPGLAFLLERAAGWRFRLLAGLGFALTYWNLLLVLQYTYGLIPQDAGLGPQALLANTWQFARDEPGTCLLVAEVLGLLWLLLAWRNDTPVPAPQGAQENSSQYARPSAGHSHPPRTDKLLSGLFLLVCSLSLLVRSAKHVGFHHGIQAHQNRRDRQYALSTAVAYNGDRPHRLLSVDHPCPAEESCEQQRSQLGGVASR